MDNPLKRKSKYFAGGRSLQSKVSALGGPSWNALQKHSTNDMGSSSVVNETAVGGIYGSRRDSKINRRTFLRTPREYVPSTKGPQSTSKSVASSYVSRFSRASNRIALDPRSEEADVHIVCAISENLARDTCVASMDAGSPISMHVSKQGNGQTYAETLAYLEALRPDEVLLNEGRRNSQLAQKVCELYNQPIGATELPGAGAHRKERRRNNDDGNEQRYGSLEDAVVVKFVSRACFDQTKGAELLHKIAREETYDASMVEEYILLSSAHALLHYIEQCLGVSFLENSLYLTINSGGNNRMTIDRSTMLQLELLVNVKTGKVQNSLIGTIDCTKTTVGSRLLRSNLMSPPARADTINTRLELVDLFLSNAEFFYDVMDYLKRIPDIDKMLSNVILIPHKAKGRAGNNGDLVVNERLASKGISALVFIKSTLQVLPSFARVLQDYLRLFSSQKEANDPNDDVTIATDRSSLLVGLGGGINQAHRLQHHLLRAIIFAMTHPDLATIILTVSDLLTENTAYTRNAHAMRHQECFALKCGEDRMMSVLRKAFLANVDDIYKKADAYAELYSLTVSVRYTTSRGYYLQIPVNDVTDLPPVFIVASKSGRFINCTTADVKSLNSRAQDNVLDLLLITHNRIQEALNVARKHYDAIATLCDSIALLDMCHSFADNVVTNSTTQWCRPDISERFAETDDNVTSSIHSNPNSDGMMVIRKGRFPIDVSDTNMSGDGCQEYVPNDTFASDEKMFTVISGINGSGKSTYLKQIAIITILAHCGSYVPAESAKIPIRDRVCCRIGSTDDQEHNLSTFLLEMKETAFICNNATDRSLVLIDELGCATSNEDGVAIAWSVSEYLLKQRAMTFFVTHYPQLYSLATVYPIVQNIHLQASVSNSRDVAEISYTHKAVAGPCSVSTDYGVKLAVECGWPIEVVRTASQIQDVVISLLPEEDLGHSRPLQQLSDTRTKAYSILGRLRVELQELISDGKVSSIETVRSNLIKIQEQCTQPIDSDIAVAINRILRRDDLAQRNAFEARVRNRSSVGNNMTHRDTKSNIVVTEDALIDLDDSGCGHLSDDLGTSSDPGSSICSDSSDD